MNRKQALLVIFTILVIISLMSASVLLSEASDPDNEELRVVATFYPISYMVEAIGGERVSVACLIPYNTEVHSYSPTFRNMYDTKQADIIMYNGGPADSWLMSDVLPSIDTDGKLVVNTTLGVEYISGAHEHEGEEHEEGSVDPHTWTSPRQAQIQARNVFLALCQADPNGTTYYEGRFDALNSTLAELDQGYQSLSQGDLTTIIVSHSAFGYVANDYGFEQEGVIGLSGDEEPSVDTIASLVELMMEDNIYTVFTDPEFSGSYADILEEEVEDQTGHDVQLLELYLMTGPIDELDYIEQMSQNLISLKTGLGVV